MAGLGRHQASLPVEQKDLGDPTDAPREGQIAPVAVALIPDRPRNVVRLEERLDGRAAAAFLSFVEADADELDSPVLVFGIETPHLG